MPDIGLKIGQVVRLKGIQDGNQTTVQTDELTITSLGRAVVNVKNKDGVTLQVHRSRIAEVTADPSLPETVLVTQPVEVQQVEETEEVKQPRIKENKPSPFDLDEWVKTHGGIHLAKQVSFDHVGYECTSHIVIDEVNGFYYTLNVYKYPDGTVSRGKNGAGGNKFPLDGHRASQPTKDNKEPRLFRGSRSASDLIKAKLKKGYKLLSGQGDI